MGGESGRCEHAVTSGGPVPARISGGYAWWRCPVAGGHVDAILYWFRISIPLRPVDVGPQHRKRAGKGNFALHPVIIRLGSFFVPLLQSKPF